MWESTGKFVLKYRIALLLLLGAATAFMAWHASKVELSYDFCRAIPWIIRNTRNTSPLKRSLEKMGIYS